MSLITLSVVTSVKYRLNWQYQDVSGSLPHAHVKSLSQITPGPCTASKNEYFVHFRTVPGRLPSDFTGAGTILTTRTGAGVSKRLLPILPAFSSNR